MALIETALQLGTVPLPASNCCQKRELAVSLLLALSTCPSPGQSQLQQPARGCASRAAKCWSRSWGQSTGTALSKTHGIQAFAFLPALQLVYARNLWHVQQQQWHFLCCLVPALSKHSG